MVDMVNVGVPQVANRAFVALAVEAGIIPVIQSLVPLAADKLSLLHAIKATLADNNPSLSVALNMQTLDAILAYMNRIDGAVISADALPMLLNAAGPASVAAARDGGNATQVNVTFSAPPEGYTSEIYLDGVFQKQSALTGEGGFVNEAILAVSQDGIPHTIRVLYRDSAGNITRFGILATFS